MVFSSRPWWQNYRDLVSQTETDNTARTENLARAEAEIAATAPQRQTLPTLSGAPQWASLQHKPVLDTPVAGPGFLRAPENIATAAVSGARRVAAADKPVIPRPTEEQALELALASGPGGVAARPSVSPRDIPGAAEPGEFDLPDWLRAGIYDTTLGLLGQIAGEERLGLEGYKPNEVESILQTVTSFVLSILPPKNLPTVRRVEPTPTGPSDVHSADMAVLRQLLSLSGLVM